MRRSPFCLALAVLSAVTSALARGASGPSTPSESSAAAISPEGSGESPAGDQDDAGAARAQFFQGRAAWGAGDFETACAHFRASQKLKSSPAALLNLGQCSEHEGDPDGATRYYERSLSEAETFPDQEKAALWMQAARQRLDALAAERQEAASTQSAPPPTTAEAPTAATSEPATPEGANQASDASWAGSVLPWALVGVGGAMLGGSVATALVTRSAHQELERECTLPASSPDRRGCPPDQQSTKDRAETAALATDILWIGGLVSAAAGVTIWLADGSTEAKESSWSSSTLAAGCDAHGCAASLSGRF